MTVPKGSIQKTTSPGRPRSPKLERLILQTTLRHLAADGYARASVDKIAVEAGVSKPTIYRRWATKADLAIAALTLLRVAERPVSPDDPRQQLVEQLRNFRASLLRPNGMALIGTVLAEEGHNPGLLVLLRERIVNPRRRLVREILERAREEGSVGEKADLEAAVNALVGSFYARYLTGMPIEEDWPERVVEVVWRGIAGGNPAPPDKDQ